MIIIQQGDYYYFGKDKVPWDALNLIFQTNRASRFEELQKNSHLPFIRYLIGMYKTPACDLGTFNIIV